MNFQEKYDNLILLIDEKVQTSNFKLSVTIDNLSAELGYSKGALSDAFQFITNISLRDYILRQRIICALRYQQRTQCSQEELVQRFNFADAPTFSKRCNRFFGFSPSQVTPDWLNAQSPWTLQNLLKLEEVSMATVHSVQKSEPTYFGVSQRQFKAIKESLELRSLYGFSEKEADFAYKLSEKYSVSLKDTFEFIDEVKLNCGSIWHAQRAKDFPFDLLSRLCLQYHLSVSEAQEDIQTFILYRLPEISSDALNVYYSPANSMLGLGIHESIKVADALAAQGLTSDDLDEIFSYSDSDNVSDLIEVIQNYDQYSTPSLDDIESFTDASFDF